MRTGPDTDDGTVASGLPRAEDAAPSVLGEVIAAYLGHLSNRRVSRHTLRAYGGDLSALDGWLVENGYSGYVANESAYTGPDPEKVLRLYTALFQTMISC